MKEVSDIARRLADRIDEQAVPDRTLGIVMLILLLGTRVIASCPKDQEQFAWGVFKAMGD